MYIYICSGSPPTTPLSPKKLPRQTCGAEAMTINKFFGISCGDERLEKFDYSDVDVIVFDEIIFHNVGKWALIWDFCKNNPEQIVVATGDSNQLKNQRG